MAKKHKNYEPTSNEQPMLNDEPSQLILPTDEPKKGLNLVAKPAIHLLISGIQFAFTRFTMIKKAAKLPDGDFKITLDGVETPVWTTSSKGWAKDDATIDYIWFVLPNGTTGYITLDYNQPASDFANAGGEVGEGKADRADPKRVPGKPDVEEARKDKFRDAMAKKVSAAAPVDGEQPVSVGRPEGETDE